MLKKLLGTILVMGLSLFISTAALAGNSQKVVFKIGSQSYSVDGAIQGMDAAPFIESGRTFVPVRYLGNGLGAQTDYKDGIVTVTKDGKTIKLVIGGATLDVNGSVSYMDVVPEVLNDRTYLPARFVAEAFGYQVDFANNTVTVSKPQAIAQGPFDPAAKRLDMKLGSSSATVTGWDGGRQIIQLDTAPFFATISEQSKAERIARYPAVYNESNLLVDTSLNGGCEVVPLVSVAKAFGVPEQNLKWDGNTLRYYQGPGDYMDITPGQPIHAVGKLKWIDQGNPGYMRVQNGVLMISGYDLLGLLLRATEQPIMTTGFQDTNDGFSSATGEISIACKLPFGK